LEGADREKSRELTDDDLYQVGDMSEKLVGLLQRKYGYAKEKVETRAYFAEIPDAHTQGVSPVGTGGPWLNAEEKEGADRFVASYE